MGPKKLIVIINALLILTILIFSNCNSGRNMTDTFDIRVYYTDYIPSRTQKDIFGYFDSLRTLSKKNRHIRLTFIPESESPLFIPESRYYGIKQLQVQDYTGKVYDVTSGIAIVYNNHYRRIPLMHNNIKNIDSVINSKIEELKTMKHENSYTGVNKLDMNTEYNYPYTLKKPPVPKKHVLTALVNYLNNKSFYISTVTATLPVRDCIPLATIKKDSLENSKSGVGVLRVDFMESNCRQAIDCGLMKKNIVNSSDSICKTYSLTETGRKYSTNISTWFNENCIAFKAGEYKLNRILDISGKVNKKSHKTTFTYYNVSAEVKIVNKAPWVSKEYALPDIDTLFPAVTKVNGKWIVTNRITP